MSELGKIKQIIGAVIDVEFGKEQIPNIYDALRLARYFPPTTVLAAVKLLDCVRLSSRSA